MPRITRRRRTGCWFALLLVLVAGLLSARWIRAYIREHPQEFPFTPLNLADPVGPFTAAKLAALTGDPARCRGLLVQSGARDRPAPPARTSEPACAFDDGMVLVPSNDDEARFTPTLTTACPVAAALRLWERERLQPAALAHLGSRVTAIETFGSYSCRRKYGRADGGWSEHATGDAVDIAAFRLDDGRRIRVLADWRDEDAEGRFLRAARDGACDLFSTVLSPDYNAAHRDHLHFDMAARGQSGWSLCR